MQIPDSPGTTDTADTATQGADLPLHLLPKLLQTWVAAIGLPATLALVKEHGGFRIYIPKTLPADHHLVKLLGAQTAQTFITAHGQEPNVVVPKAMAAIRAVRDAKIMREYGPKTAAQLAREHGLSEPAIWRIVERHTQARAAHAQATRAGAQTQLW